ncbi:MAG: hypothetical protein LBQ19_04915 [Synergistaceae bacterium]|jgi:tRNA nucleotidyltransferase (CCA-adding enzyme)|nr:hypothetical protein [Synergistaceae bacterium]
MKEAEFVERVDGAGGRAFIVGGWVRDRVMGVAPRDKDYLVTGVAECVFRAMFPDAFKVGGKFPVYLAEIDGERREVAFARSEAKSAGGHRGFDISFSPLTTVEEDLFRRDATVNAMAVDLLTGELIDPYGGAGDIRDRVIRAVSGRFADDPVRALRAARQAAQFGFRIEPDTVGMMRACREELRGEPRERFIKELALALDCAKPSIFFTSLLDAGVLDVAFPQLYALAAASEDIYARCMEALDKAADLTEMTGARFAALANALCGQTARDGPALPSERHERALSALMAWNATSRLPRLWMKCALFAMRETTPAANYKSPEETAGFLERLNHSPLGAEGFTAVMLSAGLRLPEFLKNHRVFRDAIASVKASDAPPELKGAEVGEWLKARRAAAVSALLFRYQIK